MNRKEILFKKKVNLLVLDQSQKKDKVGLFFTAALLM